MPTKERFGTYEWVKRTSGAMSSADRWRACAAIASAQPGYVIGLILLAAGRTSRRASALSSTLPTPPDSRLAKAAERAWRHQRPHVRSHSYRTWPYGHALALFDDQHLDRELFYVACLLHDYGLEQPRRGEDFTMRSAERAMACIHELGLSGDAARAVADAIMLHVTPGIRPERDGALGCYLQAGSLLGLAGARAWELPRTYHDAAAKAHSRKGVTDEFISLIRAEARANPGSRFSLLYRCGITLTFRLFRTMPGNGTRI